MVMAVFVGIALPACSSGGGPGEWYLPSDLRGFRPAWAKVGDGRRPVRSLVVYGPPAPALPDQASIHVRLEVEPATGDLQRLPAATPSTRRVRLGSGVADVFTDGSGWVLAANLYGWAGFSGSVLVQGDLAADELEAALRSAARIETPQWGPALVLRRPPPGLVRRYGPAPPPPDAVTNVGRVLAQYVQRDADGVPVAKLAVGVERRPAVAVAELAWGVGLGRIVAVGDVRGVLVEDTAGPLPVRWLVSEPEPGVFVLVVGEGVSRSDLLAFARSLRPVSERRWKAAMAEDGVDWRHPGRPPEVGPSSRPPAQATGPAPSG